MHRRRILFAGSVARMKDMILPKCIVFGELMGRGLHGGKEKEWTRCLLDYLRALSINADQLTNAVQDEGELRKTTGQGTERFMAKWIAAEKAGTGLRHAVVCPNVR